MSRVYSGHIRTFPNQKYFQAELFASTQVTLYGQWMKLKHSVLSCVLLISLSGCTKTVYVAATEAPTSTSLLAEAPSTEASTIASTTENCCEVFEPTMPTSSTFAPPQNETVIQKNARLMAQQYLDSQAFSRQGLIDQLLYEGFSESEAVYGVDAVHADWRVQAVLMARQYLNSQAFSRQGLFDQLLYEGFTEDEATIGLANSGL